MDQAFADGDVKDVRAISGSMRLPMVDIGKVLDGLVRLLANRHPSNGRWARCMENGLRIRRGFFSMIPKVGRYPRCDEWPSQCQSMR